MPSTCATDSFVFTDELLDEIGRLIQPLKDERDMWKVKAEAYKAAFESQTTRLREAIDLCIATKIELENVRARRPFQQHSPETPTQRIDSTTTLGCGAIPESKRPSIGCEDVQESNQPNIEWQSNPVTQENFGHVEILVNHADISRARNEIDRILPGRLSNEVRIEGLLLKSAICRASGPEWVLEGLAQCSEALTLCNEIASLEYMLPKIHFHRGLCLLLLRQLDQARDAFAQVGPSDPLHGQAIKYRESCEDELAISTLPNRRSAFDEHRSIESYIPQRKDSESGATRRRMSVTRTRLFSASKPIRRSIPQRWMSKTTA